MDSRHRLITCYVCGRQYGHASINIHQPQCLEKWRCENSKLPPNQRRPEPVKVDSPNALEFRKSRDAFSPETSHGSLIEPRSHSSVHQRSHNSSRRARAPQWDDGSGPQEPLGWVRIGYINGNEYGMDTYAVNRPPPGSHSRSGPRLRQIERDRFYGGGGNVSDIGSDLSSFNVGGHTQRLPGITPNQNVRPPYQHVRPTEEQLNRIAYDNFQANLIQCRNCGRRFRQERLPAHQLTCAEHPEFFRR